MRRCANALHWVTQTLLLLFCSFVDLDLAALFMTNKSCGPLLPMPFTGEKAATIKSHTFQAANKCVLLHLNFKFPFIHIKYLSHAKHLLLHFQPISLGITGASPALTWGNHKTGICAFGLSCSSTCFNSFLRMGPDTRLVSRSLLVAALPVSRLPKSPPGTRSHNRLSQGLHSTPSSPQASSTPLFGIHLFIQPKPLWFWLVAITRHSEKVADHWKMRWFRSIFNTLIFSKTRSLKSMR